MDLEPLHATLVEGDPIDAAFLFGEFFLNDSSAPVVLLSASVGLTPLLAMFNKLAKTDLPARGQLGRRMGDVEVI